MTISNETAAITLNGNGSQTSWGYNFLIPYQSNGVTPAVRVFLTHEGVTYVKTRGVDYSISGVGNANGGTVSYPLTGDPLPVGWTITIERDLDYIQPFSFTNGNFRASTLNKALDNIVMQVQQLKADFDRFS